MFERKSVLMISHVNCLLTIHMKCQDLFSLEKNEKKKKKKKATNIRVSSATNFAGCFKG